MCIILSMAKHSFFIDEDGKHSRIWIESKVADPKILSKFQKEIIKEIPSLRLYPESFLHITLFHFGQPWSKYKEFSEAGMHIGYEEFLKRFESHLKSIRRLIDKSYKLKTKNLDIFGSGNHRVLAIDLEQSEQLNLAIELLKDENKDFFLSLGIKDLKSILSRSRHLQAQFTREFRPHVSLGVIGSKNVKSLPLMESFPMEIELLPTSIANFM